MSFFRKLFGLASNEPEEELAKNQPVELSLEDSFAHHFTEKGGKFLYCTTKKEVLSNFNQILNENNWKEIVCNDKKLSSFVRDKSVHVLNNIEGLSPFFTRCEHLISDTGDILFSSNQLKSNKIASLTDNFIVYATTSQLVKDIGQGLTGIKTNCKNNIPTNISAIKNYVIGNNDDNFLNYGNNNSKNLYLLLFEDL